MPDRRHEIDPQQIEFENMVALAYKKGVEMAKRGCGAWECPFYATDNTELIKVKAWCKGYYDYKDKFDS